MWATRYWAARFWCARFWCKVGGTPGSGVVARREISGYDAVGTRGADSMNPGL